MKKYISFMLMLMIIFPSIMFLSACFGDGSDVEDFGSRSKFEISFVKDLKINLEGKQGLSIKKTNCNSINAVQGANNSLLNLKHVVFADGEENTISKKYFLYTTTQSYSTGNVTYTENSIEKVTFTKNENVTEDVYDANGNLISSTTTTIEQDEIPGQLNKLYVSKNFTFMQFVPLVATTGTYRYIDDNNEVKTEYLELRPEKLVYDINGVSNFDKTNYYSSALSQSFVIDNHTGYIYKIEDFKIDNIYDDNIVTQNRSNNNVDGHRTSYFKISIDGNNLVFRDLVPNKDIGVFGVAEDKYGWIYVNNNLLNQTDTENKIVYYKHQNYRYAIDSEKQVYLLTYKQNTMVDILQSKIIDGMEQEISNIETTYGLKFIATNYSLTALIGYYKGLRLENFNSYGPNGAVGLENSIYINTDVAINCYWLNDSFDSIVLETDNYLYYKTIELENYLNTSTQLTITDFTKLSNDNLYKINDYQMDIDGNKKDVDNVYYKVDVTKTTYYQLVKRGSTFELVELEDTHYDTNIFIFQPINN